MRTVALSTTDNPYNPLTDFEEWIVFDKISGHSCCEYLDRIATFKNWMSEEEIEMEKERAIDEIVLNDPTGTFIKVEGDVPDDDERVVPRTE